MHEFDIVNMEYLIVSATALEIEPLLRKLQLEDVRIGSPVRIALNDHDVTILVTGVGMMNTAYVLAKTLASGNFDHAIQVGIAGTFDRSLQIGEVVRVGSQQYADLGVIEDGSFQDVFDLGLANGNSPPFQNRKLLNESSGNELHSKLEEVSAVSVNQISAEVHRIDMLIRKYNAQIEVMEGIAFHFACLKANLSYAEIRGISNSVETRNKKNWDIEGAVEQVNNYLIYWLQ